MPEIRLTDDPGLSRGSYRINIQGVEHAMGILHSDRLLALVEEQAKQNYSDLVTEPVYGAPAVWIDHSAQEAAALSGQTIVSPCEILATHILESLRKNLSRLLTFKSLQRLLDELVNLSDSQRSEANRRLLDELIPDKVPLRPSKFLSEIYQLLSKRLPNYALFTPAQRQHVNLCVKRLVSNLSRILSVKMALCRLFNWHLNGSKRSILISLMQTKGLRTLLCRQRFSVNLSILSQSKFPSKQNAESRPRLSHQRSGGVSCARLSQQEGFQHQFYPLRR